MGGGGLALSLDSNEVDGGGSVVFGEFMCDFSSGGGLSLNHNCDSD
jgi:hypothetical protein